MSFLPRPCVGGFGKPCKWGGENGVVRLSDGAPIPCPGCEGSGKDPGLPEFFTYHQTFTLAGLQILSNARVVLNGDAAFRMKLIESVSMGPFRIKLYDNEGKARVSNGDASGGGSTNDRVPGSLITGTGQLPFIVTPSILIPKSGTIAFDLEDTTGLANTITLAFIGEKVYPTPVE